MRGVAARLGVAVMSPYRYVTSKDDLILLMADTAFSEESYPANAPEGWRSRIELGARTLWALYRKHPWLAQIASLTRPLFLPNLMVHGEWVLGALDGHGFDPTMLFDIHVLLYSHVQGLAVHLEMEAHAEAVTGQSEGQWMESRTPVLEKLVESGRFPTFTKVVGALDNGYDLRLDALFECGLKALLDGLTSIVEGQEVVTWTQDRVHRGPDPRSFRLRGRTRQRRGGYDQRSPGFMVPARTSASVLVGGVLVAQEPVRCRRPFSTSASICGRLAST
ncbi:hypothetical protein GCM10010260_59340 [Streptomyces filipinensis]|uniref:Tetracycline repressor TetR C-terminal domain-containing protein n=1 Tax=Streptomyces filipinensis TaxID=66887 RepID=A0A918MEE7_9ACTN|nr:TetR/AcrR family transcriptional regulator C-terminal domain-containing protein [Streptomyces filipinensis]GGV12676.1 hypothetical protein GCM10010260_59340 [Streptomyces filipinensis]